MALGEEEQPRANSYGGGGGTANAAAGVGVSPGVGTSADAKGPSLASQGVQAQTPVDQTFLSKVQKYVDQVDKGIVELVLIRDQMGTKLTELRKLEAEGRPEDILRIRQLEQELSDLQQKVPQAVSAIAPIDVSALAARLDRVRVWSF